LLDEQRGKADKHILFSIVEVNSLFGRMKFA